MLPRDFVLFVEGYNRRVLDQHHVARRQAYFSLAPHLSKPLEFGKFCKDYWPLPGDADADEEKKKRLLDRLKRLKEQNGGRTTPDKNTGAS